MKQTKNLIIVESPTKARTLSTFLGANYQIQSSYGHIRDLPKSNKQAIDILAPQIYQLNENGDITGNIDNALLSLAKKIILKSCRL